MRSISILFFLFWSMASLHAQIKVQGQVRSLSDKEPLIGATVLVKGENNHATRQIFQVDKNINPEYKPFAEVS